MRRSTAVLAVAIASVVLLAEISYSATPLLIHHQGRLLDAADTPVDGIVELTFTIFEAPAGGAPLWSETHPGVAVSGGLFNTTLGSIVPLSADILAPASGVVPPPPIERWLEIQVGAESPLIPRVRLVSSPYAVAAGRVSGDIETQPGEFALRKNGGNVVGTINVNSGSALKIQHDEPEDSLVLLSEASRTELAIKTKGTGAQRYSVLVGTTPDSSRMESGYDENGDGVMERQFQTLSNASSARSRWYADLDSDGSPDYMSTQIADAAGARLAIKTKGTSAHRFGVTVGAGPDSSGIMSTFDENGDGINETEVTTVARKAMGRMKCSDVTLERAYLSVVSSDSSGSSLSLDSKLNPNSARDNFLQGAADIVRARLSLGSDSDDDGITDNSVTQTSTDTGAGLELRYRAGTRVFCGVADRIANSLLESDSDDDGTVDNSVTSSSADSTATITVVSRFGSGPRQTTSMDGSFSHSKSRCATDIDDDGVADLSAESYSDASRARMVVKKHLLEPHEAAIEVKDDGPTLEFVQSSIQRIFLSPDSGIQQYDAGGTKTVDFDANGDGYVAGNMKFGAIAGAHRIDVQGGAYCDGANWVNASDADSKENFEKVDGREILNKLNHLDITRWNYKGQPDATHIGPTAQDFREVFGVGSDGRSISTIDPSGIALVAIKELHRENDDLRAQNEDLRSELQILREQVEKLLEGR